MTTGTDTSRRSRALGWVATGVLLAHVWLLTQWLAPPTPTAAPVATVTLPPAPSTPAPPPAAPPVHTEPPPVTEAPVKAPPPAAKPVRAQPPPQTADIQPSHTEKTEEKQPTALSSKETVAITDVAVTPQHIAQAQPASEPESRPKTTAQPEAATAPGRLQVPPGAELQYDVRATRKGVSLPAQSVLRWQPTAGSYQARMEFKAMFVGTRSQTSVGTISAADGLVPTRYGDKNRSEQATHFDRTRQPPVLRFSANTPDLPLQSHTQDRLSVLLQLGAMLAGEPARFAPGHTVTLHTAGPKDADLWQFRVGKTTPLSLPAGTLDALHLERAPLHTYDNRVEVWLAPSLGYLPVRILWTQANGDVVDQQLARHSPLPLTP